MMEVMKIMVTSFKSSHAGTATGSAPKPAAGHCRLTPLPETPGHSQASLGQFLVGSLLLSSGSWYAPGPVCALQESVSPVLRSSGSFMVGLMVTPPRTLMPYAGLLHPEPLPPQQSTADLYLLRRHPNTVLSQSLQGPCVLVCTRYV